MLQSALATWSKSEIHQDAQRAAEGFAARRAAEQQQEQRRYISHVANNSRAVRETLAGLLFYVWEDDLGPIAAALVSPDARVALRYLTAPPISEADLCTCAAVPGLGLQTLTDPDRLRALLSVVLDKLDPVRIQPVFEKQGSEALAITATAVMMAAQQIQTARRGDEKRGLEDSVERQLTAAGYRQVPAMRVKDSSELEKLPRPGEFMRECTLGGDNGDFAIRLLDGRLLLLECKASNSEINSRKRLNKEAVKNLKIWRDAFGKATLGAAVIQGVFKPDYVAAAQAEGLGIVWGHRLTDLLPVLGTTL